MSYFIFFYDPYIAIIGDLKKSKKIENRKIFQQRFKEIINEVNEKYKDTIASNFTITLGDEFQGLLKSGEHLIDIILHIKNEIYPYEIRFGIGIGAITTEIVREISIGADGPGYHKARESIETLKRLEKQREVALTDIMIGIDENINYQNKMKETSLNTIFKLMYAIEKKWTLKQRETILYMLINNANQIDTANKFEVSPSNINQIINKGNYNAYKEAIENLNIIFNEVNHNDEF